MWPQLTQSEPNHTALGLLASKITGGLTLAKV